MSKTPTQRRAAREWALQTLYTVEVGRQTLEEALSNAEADAEEETTAGGTGEDSPSGAAAAATPMDETTAEFARTLVTTTLRSQPEIDPVLDRLATGFPIARQTAVDRNILRLAAAEILFAASDAPPGVVVNEAVELAKKYSTAESGRFVNGVLGALVRELDTLRKGETP